MHDFLLLNLDGCRIMFYIIYSLVQFKLKTLKPFLPHIHTHENFRWNKKVLHSAPFCCSYLRLTSSDAIYISVDMWVFCMLNYRMRSESDVRRGRLSLANLESERIKLRLFNILFVTITLHVSSVRFLKYLINLQTLSTLLDSLLEPQLRSHEKFHRNKNIILGAELSRFCTLKELMHAYMNEWEEKQQ